MSNKYLEKIAANRVTKYALEKTMPYLKGSLDAAKANGTSVKKVIDATKGSMKTSAREGMESYTPTGKLPK
jgi:hypothetical protein